MNIKKSFSLLFFLTIFIIAAFGAIRIEKTIFQKSKSSKILKILIEYQFHDDKSYAIATVDTASLQTAENITCEIDHGRVHSAVFFNNQNLPSKETRKSVPMTIVAYHGQELIVNIITDVPLQKLQHDLLYEHDLQIFNHVSYNLRVMVFDNEEDLNNMTRYIKANHKTSSFECKIK